MSEYQNRISERLFFKIVIKDAIKVLQEHILPDSKMTDHEALTELYGILDNKNIVNNMKESDWRDDWDLKAFYKWREEQKHE